MRNSLWFLIGLVLLVVVGLATMASAGTVTLNWGASEGATGYKVYVDNTHDTTAVINGLTGVVKVVNGAHAFNVTAFNDRGESPFSNTVNTPPLVTSVAPANLNVVVQGDVATFTWGAVTGAEEYRLYINGALTKTVAPTVTTTSYTFDPGSATAYVTAYNAWGESLPSNSVNIVSVPNTPSGLKITVITIIDQQ